MGAIAKAIGGLIGIGSGAKAPTANVQPAVDEVADEEAKAKKARSALLETAGGQAGAQLQPGQVANDRSTLLGN